MFITIRNTKTSIMIGNEPLSVAEKAKFCCIEVD